MSIWHEIEAYGSCSGNSKISIQTLFKERFKDTDSTITYSQAPSSFGTGYTFSFTAFIEEMGDKDFERITQFLKDIKATHMDATISFRFVC